MDAIPQWLDVVNVTPPAFSSATVNGATLVLTFDGELWERSVPKASAFTVRRTRSGSTTILSLTEPNPVAVRGRTVTLSLAEAVVRADTVTVAYTAPTDPSIGAKLRDADNDRLPVPGFLPQSVTNNTSTVVRQASFNSAAVNGNTLTVNFHWDLNSGHSPLRSAFKVTATPPGGTARTIQGSSGNVAISGKVVTVNLASAVDRSEKVTVSYIKPSANALQTSTAVVLDSFSGLPATNNTPGTAAPAFESASYAGSVITVNFDGPFTGCANKIAWSFKVDGGTAEIPPGGPLQGPVRGAQPGLLVPSAADRSRAPSHRELPPGAGHPGWPRDGAYLISPTRGLQPAHDPAPGHRRHRRGELHGQAGDRAEAAAGVRDGGRGDAGPDLRRDPGHGVAAGARGLPRHRERRPAPRLRGRRRHRRQDGAADPGIGGEQAGDTVKVRYNGSLAGLRGANGLAVDSFPDQAVTNDSPTDGKHTGRPR